MRLRAGILLSALCGAISVASAEDLGTANNFNLFALGNVNGINSDTEGRLAAGGNVVLQNYSVSANVQGGDVLIAGGNVSFTNGMVYGNIRHGGTFTGSGLGFGAGGSAIAGSPIDFDAERTHLQAYSPWLNTVAATGTDNQVFSSLVLNGASTELNVFSIDASQLSGISEVNINVPANSTVLVNVLGTNVTLPNIGYNLNGSQSNAPFQKVLWNLSEATSLSMSSFRGSILAPFATATTNFGAIEGTLVVNNFSGSLQSNNYPFTGNLPVPEPASIAALTLGVAALLRRRRK